jgi:hypothetical protein
MKTTQNRTGISRDGLNVSMLDSGTVLILETLHSFYRIVILEGKEALVTGGMTKSGEDRFPNPTKVTIVGSWYEGGSKIKVDWIGKHMNMELIYGENLDNKLIASRTTNLVIEAPDSSWSYSMDWNKD